MITGSEMARERIADRIREAEAERRSRPLAEARASGRRARVHAGFAGLAAALASALVPQRRRAVRPAV
jgi:hypothetical protein